MAQWKVAQQESGIKLIPFLRSKLGPDYSLRFFKHSLSANLCLINNRLERFGATVLGTGDLVEFKFEGIETKSINKQLSLPILYRDQDLLIIDKPAGIASDDPALQRHLSPSNLELVHRLDKETSGALIFACNSTTFNAMVELFKERKVKKKYLAIVYGNPKKNQGIIKNYLAKVHAFQGQNLWGESTKEKGLLAITEWSVVCQGSGCALIACVPITGRTHQLRVHLKGMGHPIYGDKLYGRLTNHEPQRCMLHATEISFPHPKQSKMIIASAPLPHDFLILMSILNLKTASATK